MADLLMDKKIVIGVCGGIAAYKAVELVRVLVKSGADVRVVMTRSAQAFVGSITFEALSRNPVWTQMFGEPSGEPFRHIVWAEEADAIVVVPATANIIGKMAHGIADDPLTTLVLAARSPIMVCPSMNVQMYANDIVQENMRRLEKIGTRVLHPETGSLACGDEGPGRLPGVETIAEEMRLLLSPQNLSGEHVLITAGPTQEPIDPVRHISNPSSGKMGYALARTARRRGAKVVLISGPTVLPDPYGVTVIRVRTAEEMSRAVADHIDQTSIVIKSAAVSDCRPSHGSEHKVKKEDMALQLALEPTPDILKALGEKKQNRILVGFAAETERLEENARAKLTAKNLDLVVANLIGVADSGFGSNTNEATLLYRDGRTEALPLMDKEALADVLLDRIVAIKGRGT
ncbi:MAG: bifunctional phosphopantothenoylcysteine decarboxylase/phosphopantothenate--cysteine ligase CoaBC [Deltaproteobacteria bacterium]|nr:bifunctional phosphopantothenoylcysteine decarboxylase/phosphopantothenate--cysteine ligase CoaBC [Deltaproteobacteria bacterium]